MYVEDQHALAEHFQGFQEHLKVTERLKTEDKIRRQNEEERLADMFPFSANPHLVNENHAESFPNKAPGSLE
jgi:hypothetical protein